jgi:quercetin dioxygenase-like cupin family protein
MQLAPDQPLELDASCDQLISVADGIVYVALEDGEAVLSAGDSVVIPAGAPRRAWNAGDEAASVEVRAVRALAIAA